MLKNSKIKITLVLAVLMSASVLTLAIQRHYLSAPKPVAKKLNDSAGYKAPVYDKALLARFESLCKMYDTVKKNYTLSGVINLLNKADTSERMSNVKFLCCKQGDELYYRLGETETINANGIYLYIDYKGKTILLTAQKPLIGAQTPQSFAGIGATLKGEDYSLLSSVKGGEETISLLNEHHATCKQYSIGFDTLTRSIKHIYIRLSSVDEPLRKDKEEVIDISVAEWTDTADFKKYVSKNSVVTQQNGEWRLTERFAAFQLIKM